MCSCSHDPGIQVQLLSCFLLAELDASHLSNCWAGKINTAALGALQRAEVGLMDLFSGTRWAAHPAPEDDTETGGLAGEDWRDSTCLEAERNRFLDCQVIGNTRRCHS